jgi:hypothetical protein
MMGNCGGSPAARDAIRILVEAFLDDPYYVWVSPQHGTRLSLLRSLFTLEVEAAASRGLLLSDDRGVVVLVPPHRRLLDDDQEAKARNLIRDASPHLSRVIDDYERRLLAATPEDSEAWYLQYLAVPAGKRSRGNGSSLMYDVGVETAAASLWLHTGRPRTVPFYARFGLTVTAITLCEPHGPSVHTLWRRSTRT